MDFSPATLVFPSVFTVFIVVPRLTNYDNTSAGFSKWEEDRSYVSDRLTCDSSEFDFDANNAGTHDFSEKIPKEKALEDMLNRAIEQGFPETQAE